MTFDPFGAMAILFLLIIPVTGLVAVALTILL
jgi:hypothetical protein